MNSGHVAALPPASRSQLLNRPLSGLDGRSSDGRAIRDIVASLLAEHGGKNAPMRLVLLARAAARCWVELSKLEQLEVMTAPEIIDRAGDISSVAQRLGIALRRLEKTLQAEHNNKRRDVDPVRTHIEKNYRAVATA